MSSLKDLVDLGKQFGYEGETLRKFVQEGQARERDQRVKEKDIEREKTELQIAFEREKMVFKEKQIDLEQQAEKEKSVFKEKIELEKQASREKIELEKLTEKERIGWERDAEKRKNKTGTGTGGKEVRRGETVKVRSY
ncbi:hypothetical protein ACJMK2_005075 [Sinanodonta woodiana]|uniref:Uncharacterized protein n=1 Tax=Sinanodonta woodiana TaxID=1069815 RepID=A0ABD3VPJ7_SINWO